MKPWLLKIIFIAILMPGLNGCYTIIWSPDMEFPTEDNYGSTIYYGDSYYGDYYYYYDYPWWLDIVPPAATQAGSRDENNNTQNIRNTGERGTPTRIPELRPPSHNAPPTNTNTDGSRNNSGSSSTESTVRNSSSDSGSNSGRESTSGSSNNVRNNNGGRSSGGRK